jgi:soluble cytochrome b562
MIKKERVKMWKDVVISESYQKGHTFKEALENNFKNCDITYDDKYVWVIVDNEDGVDSVYTTEMKLVDIYEDLKTKIEEKVFRESSFDDLLERMDWALKSIADGNLDSYKTLARVLDYAIKYAEGASRNFVVSEEERDSLLKEIDKHLFGEDRIEKISKNFEGKKIPKKIF